MIRLPRLLMGVSLVLVLLSTLSYTLTGRLDAWWSFDSRTGTFTAPGSSDAEVAEAGALPAGEGGVDSSLAPVGDDRSRAAADPIPNQGTSSSDSSDDSTSVSEDDHSENSTTASSTESGHAHDTPPPSTTPSTTDGVITGDACPCTVKGVAELKGAVNLTGDLVVDGGTLVARRGVNVNGNGFQIMFMDGGRADFQGSETSTWSGTGSNPNLKRDLTFRNMRRIMFHGGAGKSTLRYFSVTDSGTSSLGDYPIHFHLNGDTTRGTLVEGVVVVNGRHHAFVPHGSHGITFRDTIAYNTRDEAYWWDPVGTNDPACGGGVACAGIDNSNDIVYQHALAHTVLNVGDSKRNSAFFLGAGRGNVVRNSAAINVQGGGDCSGFHWPEFPGKGGDQPRIWVFEDNYSSSPDCDGIFVWQNSSGTHLVDDFTGNSINHGAYVNSYHYRNPDVSLMVVHAANTRITGGTIDRLVAPKHRSEVTPTLTVEGTRVGSFLIDNGTDGGEIPGVYVINGSGLTCGEVEYDDVVAGTRVILDGVEC